MLTTQDIINKYGILAKTSMDGYWIIDSTGHIIFTNKAISDMFGYTPDELQGMSIKDIEATEDDQLIQQHIAYVIEHSYDRFESRHYRKDGSCIDVEISTSYIPEDKIIIAFIRDISARKSFDASLRSSESKYRRLYETIIDGFVIVDMEGNILEWNEAYAEMLGYTDSEITNLTYIDITPEKWHAIEQKIVENEILVKGYSQIYEKEYRHKDGSLFPVELRTYLVSDNDGKPSAMWAIIRDISKRKRTELQLQSSEERFRTLLALSPDIISIISKDGKLIYNSPNALAIHGYTQEDLIGNNTFDLIHPDDQTAVSSTLNDLLNTPESIRSVQYRYRNKDQSYTWMEATASNQADNPHIQGVVTISRDISERKEREVERINQERSLQHTQRLESLGILAGGIAHDFNNILTGVIGNISLAMNLLDETHKSFTILHRAENAAKRASDLSSQLLTFAKGGQPIKKIVHLKHVLEDLTVFVLSGSSIACKLMIPDDLHSIDADEGQMSQAFQNILINAIQAMPDGGVISIHGENIVVQENNSKGLPPGSYVRITLTDTGCGIHDDDLSKIFEPYFTKKSGGSGLGLAISYSVITKHGGHINVSTRLGEGSSFEIVLPSITNAPEQDKHAPMDNVGHMQKSLSVLVMDDEEVIRDLISFILVDLGHHVQLCCNGEEAIALYKNAKEAGQTYSVAILDLTVTGGMGGKEAAQQILANDPAACLIVSSGYSNDPVMSDYRRFGFRTILQKPYTVSEIIMVLNNIFPPVQGQFQDSACSHSSTSSRLPTTP